MRSVQRITIILLGFALCVGAVAQEPERKAGGDREPEKEKGLTLERLYPEKSFFGPSARSMAFSFDGKYAAYLYRPYRERRHGSDLWIYDAEKGTARRVTSVPVMAKFQANARKVRDDRVKKAEEDLAKKRRELKDEEKAKALQLTDEQKKGDWVTDDDATINDEDETKDKAQDSDKKEGAEAARPKKRAPTYAGIASLLWSETANELIFISEGDLFRYEAGEDRITRLTRTKEPKELVAWLPDGTGYTFRRGNAIMKVVFGNHLAEELSLGLPASEALTRYAMSPDGRSLALLARKDLPVSTGTAQRQFAIAKYRDRRMTTEQLARPVLDDPLRPFEYVVYLCKINEPLFESTQLVEVFRRKIASPGDRVSLPDWSPNSERAVFTVWEQSAAQVSLMEATFPKEAEKEGKGGKSEKGEKSEKGVKSEKRAKSEKSVEGEEGEKSEKSVKGGEGEKSEKGEEGGRGGQEQEKRKDLKDKKEDEKKSAERPKKDEEDPDKPKLNPAKVLYRFMHTGGPNTPHMIDPHYLADNRRIVFLSELTGFRQLHILDPTYESLQPLTQGAYEVYPIDITKKRDWMFVSATKEHPARLDVYRIALPDGAMTRLSRERGRYTSAAVSPDGKKVLANYVRFGTLPELVGIDAETETQKELTDSHPPVARELTKPTPEYFTYENRHGQKIYGTLFKPDGWKKEDKRPLLIYLYGGPLGTKKQVEEGNYDTSGYFFGNYMAQKHGYLTCTIDPRGCSGYGAVFEKANFEQVGRPQVEDLVDGVKFLIKEYGVDSKRVALHGWSFGGFQTQMCMYTEPDVFAAGIAGAGPTEWENYNAYYTRATIGTSRTGTPDLKKFSLLPLAKNLKGQLLLMHGVEDSNVLFQDTLRVYRELLKAKKETLVELFLDPTGDHHLGGDVKTLARYRKYEQFLMRTIGEWKSGAGESESRK